MRGVRFRTAAVVCTAVAVQAVAVGDASAKTRRDCPRMTLAGERMVLVRSFGGTTVRAAPGCALVKKVLRATAVRVEPNTGRHRVSGWRCAIYAPQYGEISYECVRRGRVVLAHDANYGE